MRIAPCAAAAALSSSALLASAALAGEPPGYYDSVDASSTAALRATLHAVIDDHTKIPYSSASGVDTWIVLELADEDPNDPARVLDVYKNASYAKVGAGNPNYDREHSWPNSYGFPDDLVSNYPYSDCHTLFICNGGYNSSRGNKPYRACPSGCVEKPTDVNDGAGGGSGTYPGNSNWSSGITGTAGSWETWNGRRGDVARAAMYMDLRYEGGFHGVTGYAEPDLVLTDDESLIADGNTGQNESVAHMGMLSVLLQWHAEDPVDAREAARNDVVYSFQGNRNPFIDHPEWAYVAFPSTPGLEGDVPSLSIVSGGAQGLALAAGPAHAGELYFLVGTTDGTVPGFEFSGFHVPLNPTGAYWALTLAGPGALLSPNLGFLGPLGSASAAFTIPGGLAPELAGLTVSHAYVTLGPLLELTGASNAVDVVLTGTSGTPQLVINEIDYDQPGADTAEYVEIFNAGTAAADLANVVLELWNGADGTIYKTIALSAAGPSLAPGAFLVVRSSTVVPAAGALSVVFAAAQDNLQNGAPDGLRLVQGATVLDGLSYEGVIPGVTEGALGGGTDNPAGPQALARSSSGTDTGDNDADFAPVGTLTPGAANP
jgi:endonuclease I